METNKIWKIEQPRELTQKMDQIVQEAISHHQVEINMVLIGEVIEGDLTFNYHYIENKKEVDLTKMLGYVRANIAKEVSTIISPEMGVDILKVAKGKFLVVHKNVDFGDILQMQHTKRAIHKLGNQFYFLYQPVIQHQIESPKAQIFQFPAQKSAKVA